MLTKEKNVRKVLLCAFFALVVGFLTLFMGNNLALASSVTGNQNVVTFNFSSSSSDFVEDAGAFSSEYNGAYHSLVATLTYENTATNYQWIYKTSDGESVVDAGFISNDLTAKTTTLKIKNVAESGVYYIKVLNGDTVIDYSPDVIVTILPKTINLKITSVVSRTFNGTNNVEMTNDFRADMLATGDSSTISSTGILPSIDAGENIYITDVVHTFSDATLSENYNIVTTFDCSRLVNISKKPVVVSFPELQKLQIENGAFVADYNGKIRSDFLSAYYKDINNNIVEVKTESVLSGAVSKKREILNAGNYEIRAIKQDADKNYVFMYSETQELGALSLKIKKIAPTFRFLKQDFVYTGYEQDLADFVEIVAPKNVEKPDANGNIYYTTEQEIVFTNSGSSIVGSKFTTFQDGENLRLYNRFAVLESDNYYASEQQFVFTLSKAEPIFNLSKLVTDYTYTGEKITISGVAVSSNQTILQSENIINVGTYSNVVLSVAENDNYISKSCTVSVRVVPAVIDVSLYMWNTPLEMTYRGDREQDYYTLSLLNVNESVVDIFYQNNRQKNAGKYLATATATLKTGVTNYSLKGTIAPLFFEIHKKGVEKPTLSVPPIFTYDGEEKELALASSMNEVFYHFTQNNGKNAGNYVSIVALNDKNNLMWADGTTDDLKFDWTIKKRIVTVDSYKTILVYNGLEQCLKVRENNLYYAVSESAIDIGEYKTILILKDKENYAFNEEGASEYVVNWKITGNKQTAGIPIVIIILVTLAVGGLGVYLTLHFTAVAKEKKERRKRLEQKMAKERKIK